MNFEIDRFSRDLNIGLSFEHAAVRMLHRHGWAVQLAGASKQMSHGDTMQHIEIKKDQKVEETGRLFIETRERRTSSCEWRDAGIYDRSDPWLLVIGHERKMWVLSVNQCRHWQPHFPYHHGVTSEGFFLPGWWADKHAVRILT